MSKKKLSKGGYLTATVDPKEITCETLEMRCAHAKSYMDDRKRHADNLHELCMSDAMEVIYPHEDRAYIHSAASQMKCAYQRSKNNYLRLLGQLEGSKKVSKLK